MYPRPGTAPLFDREKSCERSPPRTIASAENLTTTRPKKTLPRCATPAHKRPSSLTQTGRDLVLLFPARYGPKLVSRDRARERYEANQSRRRENQNHHRACWKREAAPNQSEASTWPREDERLAKMAKMPRRDGALRMLRKYESITQSAHPLHAESRRGAKKAAAAADAARAASVADAAVADDKTRQITNCELERSRWLDGLMQPIPLVLQLEGSSSECTPCYNARELRLGGADKLQQQQHSAEYAGIARQDAALKEDNKHAGDLERLAAEVEKARSFFTGTAGRIRFFHAYRDALKLSEQTDDTISVEGVGSHESVWIARDFAKAAISHGVSPNPALLKQSADGTLALRGLGLNDGIARALATVLPRLQHIRRIDISSNNLGDAALAIICQVVTDGCPHLESFDLSRNTIGANAARSIRSLLASGHRLGELRLEGADVDDSECVELTKALVGNRALTELDLSANLIGQAEALNYTNPELVTGPEAIADALNSGRFVLRVLDLSWNFIRNDSARALGTALAGVESLTELRLAHNCFADEPAQYLAAALHENTVLEVLDLSFNAISPRAALVIASMLKVNTSLVLVRLDGNPIGKAGARALMSALQTRGYESSTDTALDTKQEYKPLHISWRHCDTTRDDAKVGYFDPATPGGSYHLNLFLPYDRMVARDLLTIATQRNNCGFRKLRYYPPGTKPLPVPTTTTGPALPTTARAAQSGNISPARANGKDIKLHRAQITQGSLATPTAGFRPARARSNPPSWMLVIARTIGNHALDRKDLEDVLAWMGLVMTEEHVGVVLGEIQRLLAADVFREPNDDSSQVHLDKVTLMHHFWRAVFCLADADDSQCISKSELKAVLHFLGIDVPMKAVAQAIAEYDTDGSGVIEQEEFIQLATQKFARENTAPKTPLCEHGNTPWKVPKSGHLDIVFDYEPAPPSTDQCGSDEGVRGLIHVLKTTPSEQERAAIFDVVTSETELFLTREQAHALLEVARTGQSRVENLARILPQVATPSDCCALIELARLSRTEKLDLMTRLGHAWGPLLNNATGHYSLDMRNPIDRLAARKLAGIANSQRLASQQSGGADTSQHRNWQNFRNERWQGNPIRLTPTWFAALNVGKLKEGSLQFDYVSTEISKHSSRPISERRFRIFLQMLGFGAETNDDPLPQDRGVNGDPHHPVEVADPYINPLAETEVDSVARHWREMIATSRRFISPSFYSEVYDGIGGDGNQVFGHTGKKDGKQGKKKGKKKGGRASKKELERPNSADAAALLASQLQLKPLPPTNPSDQYRKGVHSLRLLKANIGHSYFSAAQVQDLVAKFQPDDILRVEVVLALFSRTLDLQNFATVLDSLEKEECDECVYRLGCLNVFNSMTVDRMYTLNLKIYDERQMASVLVKLAIAEPGENWIDEKFKRKESLPWSPGWQLPKEWEEEIIDYGILEARYVSSGPGCYPDLQARRALMSMFLCGRDSTTATGSIERAQGKKSP